MSAICCAKQFAVLVYRAALQELNATRSRTSRYKSELGDALHRWNVGGIIQFDLLECALLQPRVNVPHRHPQELPAPGSKIHSLPIRRAPLPLLPLLTNEDSISLERLACWRQLLSLERPERTYWGAKSGWDVTRPVYFIWDTSP